MDRNVYLPLVLRVCRWLRLKPHTEPACRPTEEVSAKCPLGQCRQPVTHNSAGGKKPGIGRGNHTHTHTHTHTPLHTQETSMHVYPHSHTYLCAHACTHTWSTQICVPVYPHAHTHTYTHTSGTHRYLCLYTHIHTCVHPHMYTP